jgi:cytochrome c biogenesis protein CcmG, thiol:disulfide interchange protein DsbE
MSELHTGSDPAVRAGRRSTTSPWVLLAIAAAVACIYLALVRPQRGSHGAHPAVGRSLPALELAPLTGVTAPVTLAELRGQVVLLNFWGTWCGPCKEEFPHIALLAEMLKDRPQFRLLSVSCEVRGQTDDELRDETREFLRLMHSSVPTYSDPDSYTRRQVAMALDDENFGYPTTVVLDQAGVIRGVWIGYDEGVVREMEQVVGTLLKQPGG